MLGLWRAFINPRWELSDPLFKDTNRTRRINFAVKRPPQAQLPNKNMWLLWMREQAKMYLASQETNSSVKMPNWLALSRKHPDREVMYPQVGVVFFGDPGVGKTTFVNALQLDWKETKSQNKSHYKNDAYAKYFESDDGTYSAEILVQDYGGGRSRMRYIRWAFEAIKRYTKGVMVLCLPLNAKYAQSDIVAFMRRQLKGDRTIVVLGTKADQKGNHAEAVRRTAENEGCEYFECSALQNPEQVGEIFDKIVHAAMAQSGKINDPMYACLASPRFVTLCS